MNVSAAEEEEHVQLCASCWRRGWGALAYHLDQRQWSSIEVDVEVPGPNARLDTLACSLIGRTACERQRNAHELCEGGLHAYLGRGLEECVNHDMVGAFGTLHDKHKQVVQLHTVLRIGPAGERSLHAVGLGALVRALYLFADPVVAHGGSRVLHKKHGPAASPHYRASSASLGKSRPAQLMATHAPGSGGMDFHAGHMNGEDRATRLARGLHCAARTPEHSTSIRSTHPRRALE